MDAVALVAAVTRPSFAAEIREIPKAVTWLQVRSDVIGDVPADWLRSCFPGKLIYTLRTHQSGGRFERLLEERHKRLIAAARDYDLIELEFASDLHHGLLEQIPAEKRMIVWRGPLCDASGLHLQFQKMAAVSARYYCLFVSANKSSDGLHPLVLLNTLRRKDVVAFGEGPSGLWSQLYSPYLGSPLLFGQLDHSMRPAGELHVKQLMTDYGFPLLRPIREIYGMVGNRVFQSPSPRLHNSAYRSLNHSAIFLPFHVECFDDFWQKMVESGALDQLGIPVRGLVIVSPFKEDAVAVAGASNSMVQKTRAGNVLMRKNGGWEAETTDPESIAAIRHMAPVKAAVIGCGGAGRAVAVALQQSGCNVTLVNRGLRRGQYAVSLLNLPFVPLSEFHADGFDVIVNATPVGKENDGFPFVIDTLSSNTLVIDLAYGAQPTPLVSAVQACGGTAIDGYDVLLTQVRRQFQLMTGLEMPAEIDRGTVLDGNATNLLSAALQAHMPAEAYECSF
jgi:3-dehydroquinate dehydratase / shikimate dehydrogenase